VLHLCACSAYPKHHPLPNAPPSHAPPPTQPRQAVRLWVHECERVFRDRMVSDADAAKFDEFKAAVTKKYFEDLPGGAAAVDARPLLFTSFMQVLGCVFLFGRGRGKGGLGVCVFAGRGRVGGV